MKKCKGCKEREKWLRDKGRKVIQNGKTVRQRIAQKMRSH